MRTEEELLYILEAERYGKTIGREAKKDSSNSKVAKKVIETYTDWYNDCVKGVDSMFSFSKAVIALKAWKNSKGLVSEDNKKEGTNVEIQKIQETKTIVVKKAENKIEEVKNSKGIVEYKAILSDGTEINFIIDSRGLYRDLKGRYIKKELVIKMREQGLIK